MPRYAVIDMDSNIVRNVIELEDGQWLPPKNCMITESDFADVGDTYDPISEEFIKANLC